ncbi:hypothetical protein C1645_767431 [Glomus cerebriforme]|uniref:HTH myb-type domain-containing protein n=1 Tax=Glomus cerebriforme TaxID=658196 RepID=A0A397T5J0_9GLOM|nr:hypothetical protein C1645_767431 [Glomus cerebriforme]
MRPRFDSKSENIIVDFMTNYQYQNPFIILSKILPRFTLKQIRDHWENELNPGLYRGPLSEDEENYILDWVENSRTVNHWTQCQRDMHLALGRLHSPNKIKAAWLSKQRQPAIDQIAVPFPPFPNNDNNNIIPPLFLEPNPQPDLTEFNRICLLKFTLF